VRIEESGMSLTPTEYERAETEAATWLVLLAEDPTDRDLVRRFEEWRASSPLNAELWARTERAYELAGKTTPNTSSVVPFARPPGVASAPSRRVSSRRRRVGVGVVAALAACLLLLATPSLLLRLGADHLTGTAELQLVTLEDGTEVRLGPESALSADFVAGERRVRLLKGEAFFDVVPDSARPFKVAAGDVVTTVLGTAFEVRLQEGAVDVAVRHGHVRVEGGEPAVSESLLAGDWLNIRRGSPATTGRRSADEIGDWIDGELVARERPMIEIVDALRRYYGGIIVVQSETFARTRVTGIYDLRNPTVTLTSLASSHDARVRRVSPWVLVVTSK